MAPPGALQTESLSVSEALGEIGGSPAPLVGVGKSGDQMYVGGLGAAAGGTASLVGQGPTAADAPPWRAPYERDHIVPRAASGAACGVRTTPVGGSAGASTARRRRVGAWLPALDLVAVAVAAVVGYVARFGFAASTGLVPDLLVAIALPLAWLLAGAANRAYDPRFLGSGTTEFRRLGRTVVSVMATLAVVSYVGGLEIARGFVLFALPLAFVLSAGLRLASRSRLVARRQTGQAMDRVLLVGRAASLPAILAAMRRDPAAGLQVVGACLPG